jgi:hypothetical protein
MGYWLVKEVINIQPRYIITVITMGCENTLRSGTCPMINLIKNTNNRAASKGSVGKERLSLGKTSSIFKAKGVESTIKKSTLSKEKTKKMARIKRTGNIQANQKNPFTIRKTLTIKIIAEIR